MMFSVRLSFTLKLHLNACLLHTFSFISITKRMKRELCIGWGEGSDGLIITYAVDSFVLE